MAVTKRLVTSNFNNGNAESFIKSFDDCNYFMYFGNHTPYAGGDGIIDQPTNSINDLTFNTFNNMSFSKRINSSDVSFVINNNEWKSGTIYDEYDHQDPNLLNKIFYVVVDDINEHNVYKCLFNNGGVPSTVSPSRVGNDSDLRPITTGDGYVWKYMYTISSTDYDKFASLSHVPVTANSEVSESAIGGTIEVIKVEDQGSGYNNYIETGIFRSGDISVNGINTIYGAPETAESIDDFYRGCVLRITSGSGINQYRKIVNYSATRSQKLFTLEEPFLVNPQVGDSYEVYPYIYVFGDGSESIGAEAIAIIDPEANNISIIEMLNVGSGYRAAQTFAGQAPLGSSVTNQSIFIDLPATISASESFRESILNPIISPPKGHGENSAVELGSRRACVSVRLEESEGGTIPVENDFRQIGIIKNPLFDNVEILLDGDSSIGQFSVKEVVREFNQIKLAGLVDIQDSNNVVMLSNFGKISETINILNAGTGYDSTIDNSLVFDNSGTGGSSAAGTFSNNSSGAITSITITNSGTEYEFPPTVSINTAASAAGSNAQFEVSLANNEEPTFDESFEAGDYVLINKDSFNLVGRISSTPNKYTLILEDNLDRTLSGCTVSALNLKASGLVSSVSTNQIKLNNVSGKFNLDSKIIGLDSAATSRIRTESNAIQINDKSAGIFDTTIQLSRLVGNFSSGSSPFEEDEFISQNSLIPYARPSGFLHHSEINAGTDDDILYISGHSGIFNLDSNSVRVITGTNSLATLDNLSNQYRGDFTIDSGSVIYYENLEAITRSGNKSENIKIIFTF